MKIPVYISDMETVFLVFCVKKEIRDLGVFSDPRLGGCPSWDHKSMCGGFLIMYKYLAVDNRLLKVESNTTLRGVGMMKDFEDEDFGDF